MYLTLRRRTERRKTVIHALFQRMRIHSSFYRKQSECERARAYLIKRLHEYTLNTLTRISLLPRRCIFPQYEKKNQKKIIQTLLLSRSKFNCRFFNLCDIRLMKASCSFRLCTSCLLIASLHLATPTTCAF